MDNYCDTIKTILEARKDPAKQEEYFYMMLSNAGYDYDEATKILYKYHKNKIPFYIKKDRPWPMLEDEIWDDMMYKSKEQRNSLQNIIDVLTDEVLQELNIDYKKENNNDE